MRILRYRDEFEQMQEFYKQLLTETRNFVPYHDNLEEFLLPERLNYIVQVKDKIIGHLTLYPTTKGLYTVGLALLKGYTGKGLGGKLLKFAERRVKQAGGSEICGSIYYSNWQSVVLFTKYGYKIIDEGEKLYAIKKL